ncbi:MAG: hypothetical protein HPZ91_08995 [Lentisphaeria bacterium]|nr:hypothetical protein [Lentisphaeria bacterium]
MKLTVLLLLAAAALRLGAASPAPVAAWEFDPAFGVKEQGLLLNGFDSAAVLPEGLLKLAVKWRKDGAQEPNLRSCYEMFVPYDSRDLGELELRLRARVSPEIAGAGVGLRVRLRYFRGGESGQQIPLRADNEFHTFRIDFAKFRHPGENSRGFYLYVYPLVNLDNAEGWAAVELDYLRVGFSEAGAVRNIRAVADEKLVELEDLLRSFKPYGITPKGAAADLRKLHGLRKSLDSGTGPGQYSAAMELNREFARLHGTLRLGRRLKELFDEAQMLENSIGRQNRQAALGEEAAQLRAGLDRIKLQLSRGEFDAARTAADVAEKSGAGLWARLLRPENGEPAWQSGVDVYSTGLFGWSFRTREGLALSVDRERIARGFFLNRDGTRTGLSIRPEGASFPEGGPEELETSWTSSDWSYPCRTPGGKAVDWKLAVSRLAPGVQLTAGMKAIRIAVNAGRDYRPTRILVPCRGGVQLLTPEELEKFRWRDMTENWLLLLCDNGLPAAPWLLTLQHRPSSVTAENGALRFTFANRAGTIGIANLYGVRPLPPDWSKEWGGPPADVAAQCRRLNAVMTACPWSCTEFFAIDREAGTVRIENRFGYRTVKNDWNYSGAEYAPLPPVLAMAAGKGYPARLPENAEEFDFGAGYGPYRAVPGDRAEYTLPLPDLGEELFVRTERCAEQQKRSRRWLLGLPDALFHFSPGRYLNSHWAWHFDGFNLYTPEEKRIALRNLEKVVDRYCTELRDEPARLYMAHHTHRHGDRTEPFSGKSYLAYGWRSKHGTQLDYRDITDIAGFHLLPILRCAQFSGNWGLIRKHWPQIADLYSSVPRRCEWASMAVGTTDRSLVHVIDMAPDSWLASEAAAKLARGADNRRTEELALCISAKQAVPLCGALLKRDWDMAHNNGWDPKTQIPELGYFDSSHINATRWDDAQLSASGVVGMIHSPALLRLYRDYCPEALRGFLARMEETYPQWADWKYIRPGKKEGQNGPTAFYRQLLLRDALGVPTGELEKLFRAGLFDGDEFSVWSRSVTGRATIVGLSLAGCAILTGRDAPLRVVGWGKAAFRDAQFSFAAETATVELDSPEPFTLELFSAVEPAGLTVNGAAPEAGKLRYDAVKKRLTFRLGPGESRVELRYPGWRPPQWKGTVRPAAPIAPTPEMKLCATERELRSAAGNRTGRTDFTCGRTTPLPLSGSSNTASGFAAGSRVVRGVPMKLEPGAVGVAAQPAGGLPQEVKGIPAKGRWKRLYFLHTAEESGTPGEVLLRYRIHYADGTSTLFEARSGLELAGRRSPADLPNGKAEPVPAGGGGSAFLSVWENPAREEVPGVVADFQKEYRMIDRIDLQFAARRGTAALLAVTGETAGSEQ